MDSSSRPRRRSRIAHFKAPFVVAVLTPVAALAAGCGARAEQEPLGADANQQTGATSNPGECPAQAPAAGSACSLNELVCDYGNDACTSGRRCMDGRWVIHAPGCNPPPVSSSGCPLQKPTAGTSCAAFEPGLSCNYPYCYGTAPLARCNERSLLWESLPLLSCNPPSPGPSCPPQIPVHGSDCGPVEGTCFYQGCQGADSDTATCSFGQWVVRFNPGPACNPPAFLTPECPEVEPVAGKGCAFDGQQCSYGSCGSLNDPGRTATCSFGIWQQLEVPCAGSLDAGVDGGG